MLRRILVAALVVLAALLVLPALARAAETGAGGPRERAPARNVPIREPEPMLPFVPAPVWS